MLSDPTKPVFRSTPHTTDNTNDINLSLSTGHGVLYPIVEFITDGSYVVTHVDGTAATLVVDRTDGTTGGTRKFGGIATIESDTATAQKLVARYHG